MSADWVNPDGTDVRADPPDATPTARMQRGLLPTELPQSAALPVDGRYLAAQDESRVGGDWFDVVRLGNGRTALIVGDVVGHGVPAIALMGLLRGALAAYLLLDPDPATALMRLDAFVAETPGAAGATVLVLVHDPAASTAELVCASAGHPPPLLITGGSARFLPTAGGVPLGVPGPDRGSASTRVDAGDTVLLYTDGLLRGGYADALLADRGLRAAESPGQLCARLLADSADGRPITDDVVLLAGRIGHRDVPALDLSVPATADQLGLVRERMHDWLTECGAGAEDIVCVQLAVGEAATNVAEYAYRAGGPGLLWLRGEASADGVVRIEVRDRGRWRRPPPGPAARGRGVQLMQDAMDSVTVEHGPDGTLVRMTRALRSSTGLAKETGLAKKSGPVARAASSALRLDSTEGPAGLRVVVSGVLDAATIREFNRKVGHLARGGTALLAIDLSTVDYLDSAGVRALFDLAHRMRQAGGSLSLHAARGTLARHVAAVTGLDAEPEFEPSRA
ncbi:SpoIIE family protein phosphatase [Solihabitans fulvus]|uniref:SpoIIE family protein phosphatase n=1 Tax=Solihabitans fulvus TaxID=1892852 RepID=A0A5B2WJ41_9PSEU|nr:SpoIIE family protein phosphatase [Solihabitans fulvus]KAA2250928.1 SpoIIE family protein phosphatase [Solihabitans fulvus]